MTLRIEKCIYNYTKPDAVSEHPHEQGNVFEFGFIVDLAQAIRFTVFEIKEVQFKLNS